jgi:predicted protein tyrosine phosphatase
MAASEKDSEQGQSEQGEPAMPHDLIDFYRRWPDFRPMAEALANHSGLSVSERQTVHWLMQLADRVSEQDLQPLRRN